MAHRYNGRCPFNPRIFCIDCNLYRGRHQECRNARKGNDIDDMKRVYNAAEPYKNDAVGDNISVRLKYTSIEEGTSREIDYRELKDAKWNDPFMFKLIDGVHMTSWKQFLQMLQFKETNGAKVVEVVEIPLSMI